jgi:outer membrane protein TolC
MLTCVEGHSAYAMVDPGGTARGPRHTWFGYAATPTCLIIAVLVIAYGVMGWCRPVQGADQRPAPQSLVPSGPVNFDEAVRIALTQSPYFVKSSLDIDIGRMDETDSRYAMVPPLTFQTYYYVNRPTGVGTSKPYSLNFSMDPYNPLGAYFTLQAQKLVSQMAVLSHLQVISKSLERLGGLYLQLDALHQLEATQKDLVQVARESLTYSENRMSLGTGTSLEVKVARQQLELALGEQEGIALSLKRSFTSLKNFLGIQSVPDFIVNYRDSRRLVLGSFYPATATLEKAKNHSYDLMAI